MKRRYLIFLISIPILILFFILITNVIVHIGASKRIYKSVEEVNKIQTAIILGAAVYADGDLSPVYKSRVDRALELYNANKVSKILASGDNSTVEHNEVNPVRNYLLNKGVPDSDIFLDHAGFDTYSTMYRARDIFEVSRVIIVTQSFHLPRAVFIARALGIDAYGIPANDEHVKLSNYIREIFANEKAMLNIIFGRLPRYLGETIPIDEEKEFTPIPKEDVVVVEEGECFIGGCSAQICSDEKDVASDCMYRPEYTCYQGATCERQKIGPNKGKCGWTETTALNQCLNGDKSTSGYIVGHVDIGPNCPVEQEDKPCPTPPEAYSSRSVFVYEKDGVTVKYIGKINSVGDYSITIEPGNYFIQIKPAGIGEGEKKPIKVIASKTITVNFNIDTGIR